MNLTLSPVNGKDSCFKAPLTRQLHRLLTVSPTAILTYSTLGYRVLVESIGEKKNLKEAQFMNINWNKKLPSVEDEDEYFIVSDGNNLSLARWANLCADNPNCGADQDEYEFKKDMYDFVDPIYWYGPILQYGLYKNNQSVQQRKR